MNPLNHVAIIMDGNGRWGLKYKNSRNAGHKEGLNTVEKVIKTSIKLKIKFLTLYAFSTENWKRPKREIKFETNNTDLYLNNNLVKLSTLFTIILYIPGLGLNSSGYIIELILSFNKSSLSLVVTIFFLFLNVNTVISFFIGTATAINDLVFLIK